MTNPRLAYRVSYTEFERGWGSKPDGNIFFTSKAVAEKYATDYNRRYNNLPSAPDYYVRADYTGPAEVPNGVKILTEAPELK